MLLKKGRVNYDAIAFRCELGEILYSTDTFLIDYGWGDNEDVIAWMPIPELPKEEKK